jgi:tyrosyl-tRNA synthetase
VSARSAPPIDEQLQRIAAGAHDFVAPDELRRKLERARAAGSRLTVKVGFDPTAPDIHLGHTVLMRKMRDFQDLGHRVVYVIGDFTASIGDPSGRSRTRPPLSREEIEENARTYTLQAFKILSESRTETRFNSEWLGELGTEGVIKLASRYTVARMLERRDFRERLDSGAPISVHELLYPLMQAYDSVVLEADVELGGTDQLFNLNVGRDLMPQYGLEPQVIITVPLLEGTDGVAKMSKSLDNYVGVDEPPREIFGKVMSISDELMLRWYELLTDEGVEGARRLKLALEAGDEHPRELKARLAARIVERFHGERAARDAAAEFERVFAQRRKPDEIPERSLAAGGKPVPLSKLLAEVGLARSIGEARRLVRQGGVRIDDERVDDESRDVERSGRILLQVGKRRFLYVSFSG